MPRIVLIRHASPILDFGRCSANEAQQRPVFYNQTDNLLLEETETFQQSKIYRDILSTTRLL